MTSPSSRILLPVGLTIALIAGFKSGQRTGNDAPPAPRAMLRRRDIQRAPGQSIEEILKGRVAGVTVRASTRHRRSHPRRDLDLRSNEPLYASTAIPAPGPPAELTASIRTTSNR